MFEHDRKTYKYTTLRVNNINDFNFVKNYGYYVCSKGDLTGKLSTMRIDSSGKFSRFQARHYLGAVFSEFFENKDNEYVTELKYSVEKKYELKKWLKGIMAAQDGSQETSMNAWEWYVHVPYENRKS